MDFFDQQDRSRCATRKLVGLYGLAVLGMALMLHAGTALVWSLFVSSQGVSGSGFGTVFTHALLNPDVALVVFALTFGIIGSTSLYRIMSLRSGGASVALAMGGRRVAPTTRDLRERRLLNVVEEMALAAGVSMPGVFVLDNERGMNAFAAGFSPKDAAVAVTRGLLETLSRDELQAVIGHEFSHILNGDMRLNIRLIGVLYGIFALTIFGVLLMRISVRIRGGKKNGGGIKLVLLVLGAVCWLVGQVGFFFGRLIQSGISRQREFLADASAVQFTRNPQSLADALTLIASAGSGLETIQAASISHMLFASGLSSLFATHPPILQRIRACNPSFDGNFAAACERLMRNRGSRAECAPAANPDEARLLRTLGATLGATAWLGDDTRQSLRDAPHAQACLCASLLSGDDPAVRVRQLTLLPPGLPEQLVLGWEKNLRPCSPSQRRQTCELAVNTLRGLPPAHLNPLIQAINQLIAADGKTSPFEFAMICMIRRRLLPPAPDTSVLPPRQLAAEITRVLSVIAGYETSSPETLALHFNAGAASLVPLTGPLAPLSGAALRDFNALDAALTRLARLAPLHKREFMLACQTVARADHTLTETEDNLLFAIADAIEATGWKTGHVCGANPLTRTHAPPASAP